MAVIASREALLQSLRTHWSCDFTFDGSMVEWSCGGPPIDAESFPSIVEVLLAHATAALPVIDVTELVPGHATPAHLRQYADQLEAGQFLTAATVFRGLAQALDGGD